MSETSSKLFFNSISKWLKNNPLEDEKLQSQLVAGLIHLCALDEIMTSEVYNKFKNEIYIKYKIILPVFAEIFAMPVIKATVNDNEENAVVENKFSNGTKVILPTNNKLTSEFATEVADKISSKNEFFFRPDSKTIIEIRKIKLQDSEDVKFMGFSEVTPNRFITLVEQHITPGCESFTKENGLIFNRRSMSAQLAKTVLCSAILENKLPQIDRIFTIPLPILYKGKLTFPIVGYDKRFNSWLPYDAPKISKPEMSLKDAKIIINTIFEEFCYQNPQDKTNAISALLTPFLRGLFSDFNVRTPVFFYMANRERAGKDYMAGVTSIVYEGHVIEDPPVSTSENARSNNTDELRKKLMGAFIAGRKRIHFSNNKGYINNATLESVVTSTTFSDRVLGRSENLTFANEMDFSLSGNTGVGFTADFANRCRFVRLFLDIEDANTRAFEKPNLHGWIIKNREDIISALYALVRNWMDNKSIPSSILFASFPEWAKICGGIMEAAELGNPCVADKETIDVGGDDITRDMKLLFEICYNLNKDKLMTKLDIQEQVLLDKSGMFSHIDFLNRSGQTAFGMLLSKFIGRILSDIKLDIFDKKARGSDRKFKFIKLNNEEKGDKI